MKEHKWFANIDRIAFLQFDVESSYFHPDSEVCSFPNSVEEERYSCAEFRRRKILTRVFTVCSQFKVEILLLPEYSVRPDTVLWIKNQIQQNNYKFSVWAGTFRIPANSNHVINEVLNKTKTNEYTHCAVLPIITHDENEVTTIAYRFKKYPAVNLQEIIQPRIDNIAFIPILRIIDDGFFQDARDDVIELICAEIFMLTSASNHNQSIRRAFELHRRYVNPPITWEDFQDKCFNDIKAFGEYTALHQLQNKYGRHSIILIPASTTRATDYYVYGQAGYLASGLTTVFCNMISEGNGGSCFIGTNSWDKTKNQNAEFLKRYSPEYTPYFGLSPGIYQQNLSDVSRGALGSKEQALVICDVNPQISFGGRPNPETMGNPLELVAHLPIVEINFYSHITSNEPKMRKCRCSLDEKEKLEVDKRNQKINEGINEIYGIIKKIEKEKVMDYEIAKNICKAFDKMGTVINSEWLIKRGKQCLVQYNNLYQNPISPNLLDWILVNVTYPSENDMLPNINVPEFNHIEKP